MIGELVIQLRDHLFTPKRVEVFQMASLSFLGGRVDHKVGTLEPGKLTDLLVVDGNPWRISVSCRTNRVYCW